MSRLARLLAPALALALLHAPANAQARLSYTRGQNVAPAYEGWRVKPDGSKVFMFGYMNRNWQEEPIVAAGPENGFSPGPADQGQPTRFQPRRNRFVFEVPVPRGFSETDEMVWTLKVNGVEEKAYASLRPDYLVDDMVIASENGSLGEGTSTPETRSNKGPTLRLEGAAVRRVKVGEPLVLVAHVADDGRPTVNAAITAAVLRPGEKITPDSLEKRLRSRMMRPPSRITVGKTVGLHFAWSVLRGDAPVGFDPIQIKTWEDSRVGANSPWSPLWIPPPVPEDGRWVVRASFSEPGVYVLHGRADDGALYDDVRVTVHVSR